MSKRPLPLTIACAIGLAFIMITFPGGFSPTIKKLGMGYPALFGLLNALAFIGLIGIWHLKRWGVLLFLVIFFIRQTIGVLLNMPALTNLYVESVIGVAFIFYFRQLKEGL